MGQNMSSFFSFSKGKPIKMVMLGLEDGGKTTMLYKMNLGKVIHKIPSIAFHIETIDTRNLALTCWDIHPNRIKALWNPFLEQSQGVIFVIDLSNSDEFSKAMEELYKLFNDERLQDAIFLIFANKMDRSVIKVEEIYQKLQLDKVKQLYHIQVSCAITGEGLKQGMDWLTNAIQQKGL